MILPSRMLTRISRNYRNKVAFHCGPVSRTWGEMDERAGRLAAGLIALGGQAGDSVVIFGQESIEVFEHYFACMKSGLVRVSVNWRYAPYEIAHILKDCSARIVLVQAGRLDTLREALEIAGLADQCVVVGYGAGHGAPHDYDQLLARSEPMDAVPMAPDAPLVISYTSGSSGVPKGVLHSARNVGLIIYQGAVSRGLTTDDVWYPAIASSWMACVLSMIGLVNGMTTLIMDGAFDAATYAEEIAHHKVTAVLLTPTMIGRVLDCAEGRPEMLASLRLLCYGSSPISVPLLERVLATLNCRMLQTYGLTEGGWISHLTPSDHDRAIADRPELLTSVGRPGGMYEISIRDEDGRELPPGQAGELWIRGETTMLGYLNLPEATRSVLTDGWLRTNDIGRVDEENYLFLIDRKNFMIISGAINIHPSSVEAVLCRHPDIEEVAIVGAPHPEWGEAVVAVIKPRMGRDAPDIDELGVFAKSRLSRVELPKHVIELPELPKTHTGKIDKHQLKLYVRSEAAHLPWLLENAR